ncbi:MAG: PSD1 and planctomycete cytochrome C domain-containing protein [Chthonomonadales bacterium]
MEHYSPNRLSRYLMAAAVAFSPAVTAAQTRFRVDYLRDVQPIFRAHCYQCHGASSHQAGLRLDQKKDALKGGMSGPAILPGNSAGSLLLARVQGLGGKPRMPYGFAPLTPQQIATLRAWVDAGAPWPEGKARPHWAYIPPRRPPLPQVKRRDWCRNGIDFFVLARLEKEHLLPSPPASKSTLLRRVSLDLTGLPPTPAELDAFLADRSPNAYEKVVDRLLASPHFGERWARPWLDMARYADTNGYEKDARRSMWPYRDWVIAAFNQDMPFNQFTIQQIAGDLLPGATRDQLIATGFHRNTMINEEGGVDREEQRWLTLVDRVATTSAVWLGTTLQCAQCHDHKYDPFTQKDYYRFFAFFDHTEEPVLDLPTPQQQAERARLQSRMDELDKLVKAPDTPKDQREQAARMRDDLSAKIAALSIPTTLIMREKQDGKTPSTYTHIKGAYLSRGELVTAGTPAALNPFPRNAPLNRLGLALWITDPQNPLTARVTVNRLWETLFGRGIVETTEDFGTQGSPPTHPELLDWLATEFLRRGWSIKSMLRLMVTSATYQQSSRASAALLERDPYNKLLARGPRFRMEAEMIRDCALAAAGLLSLKIGGPSVFPLQPEGIWQIPYNADRWVTSEGADRYRRSLYTFWRRTSPYPQFVTFDAPSREFCTVRRIRTTTPLQALTTLNDPAFIEAARGLAARMGAEASVRRGIALGFRLCTARRPKPQELASLERLYQAELRRYQQDAQAACALAGLASAAPDAPERAARMVVANVLLNMDEFLTKE